MACLDFAAASAVGCPTFLLEGLSSPNIESRELTKNFDVTTFPFAKKE